MGTWSYTIMGNSEAWVYWSRLYELIQSSLSDEEDRLEHISDDRVRHLIEERYEDLIRFIIEQKSRLAYQVFGVFLMKYGAKMINDIRELILKYSSWEDEKDQLIDEDDKSERFFYLTDFHNKINQYKEGVKTPVYYEASASVIVKLRRKGVITTKYPFITPPQKVPIDYSL